MSGFSPCEVFESVGPNGMSGFLLVYCLGRSYTLAVYSQQHSSFKETRKALRLELLG